MRADETDDTPRKKREICKIDDTLRKKRLSRPLRPSVSWDSVVSGFRLIVTTRRAFWAVDYQPRGRNPKTGRRWGGGTRLEIADAQDMSTADARAAAMAAKAAVRQGRDPHREAMASRASVEASRSIIPSTAGEALDGYAKALAGRTTPSGWSRRQAIHYARKAVKLMRAKPLPLAAIDVRMARLLFETMKGRRLRSIKSTAAFDVFSPGPGGRS